MPEKESTDQKKSLHQPILNEDREDREASEESEEERLKAKREEQFMKYLSGCSLLMTVTITIIVIVLFLFFR